MVVSARMSLSNVRQQILSTEHGNDIYNFPNPGKKFFIGEKAPRLKRFTRRLRREGLIISAGKGKRKGVVGPKIFMWKTTGRFVEYCEKYKKSDMK